MAQRITQLFQSAYGVESSEGDGTLGTASETFLHRGLPDLRLPRTMVERRFPGLMGRYKGRITDQDDPGVAFTCELRAGGGAIVSDLDELYKTVFGTRTLDSGDATSTGSSTTTVLDVDDTSDFTAGNAVLVETGAATDTYEMAWIQSVDSGTQMTLEQALSFTPANGAAVKPTLTYSPAASGHQSLAFQVWLDASVYIQLLGCKGSLKIEAPSVAEVPIVTFDFKALGWTLVTGGSRPTQTPGDTGLPPKILGGRFAINGTATDIVSFMADVQQQISRKKSQNSTYGTASLYVTDRDAIFSARPFNSNQTEWTAWSAETERELTHQFGDTLQNTVGIRIPAAQNGPVALGEEDGLATDDVTGSCNITSGNDEVRLALG